MKPAMNVPAVTCLTCGGIGFVSRPHVLGVKSRDKCILCDRFGDVRIKDQVYRCKHCESGYVIEYITEGTDMHTCITCGGVGEVRVVNPVLMRGAIR